MSSSATGEAWPDCTASDPASVFSYSFDLAPWDPAVAKGGYFALDVDAGCVVDELEHGSSVNFALSCRRPDGTSARIAATLESSSSLLVPLVVGGDVVLRYVGHGATHHTVPGSYFTIREKGTSRLLLAGVDERMLGPVGEWLTQLGPLEARLDPGLCPVECVPYAGSACTFFTQREALLVSLDGRGTPVLDGHLGTIDGPSDSFSILVAAAFRNSTSTQEVNDYRMLVVRK